MTRVAVEIELLEDVVLTRNAASAHGQPTLDCIPGATLLGAAAARLYDTLSLADAFTLFHSGAVSFGNGLPVDAGGDVTWPAPRCWWYAKEDAKWYDEVNGVKRVSTGKLHNGLHGMNAAAGQPKLLRKGYIGATGCVCTPRQTLRLRTAIDPATGRAAEGQLFGYTALQAGQRFRAELSAGDDAADALLEQAVRALAGSDTVLGRSRSAEYGRVHITRVAAPAWPETQAQTTSVIHLWLLSDLCILDASGQPTLVPQATDLGLPAGGTAEVKQWFAGTRHYAPWNGKRGGRDRGRQVLTAGSVLAYSYAQPVPLEPATVAALRHGVGLHREQGLGRIAVQPALLASAEIRFAPAPTRPVSAEVAAAAPLSGYSGQLKAWLEGQRAQASGQRQSEADGLRWFKEWKQKLDGARFFLPGVEDIGPSASQLGALRDAAGKARGEALAKLLFEGDSAVCKRDMEGWKDTTDGSETLHDWFKQKVGRKADAQAILSFVREAQRLAQHKGAAA